VQIIVARNDPLNVPGAVEALEKIKTRAVLTVLPAGGHLGFMHSDTIAEIAGRLFPASAIVDAPGKQKK